MHEGGGASILNDAQPIKVGCGQMMEWHASLMVHGSEGAVLHVVKSRMVAALVEIEGAQCWLLPVVP